MDFALTERGNSGLVYQFWEQWTEHQDILYQCCLRLMNSNRTDAEDALSRATLKAWEKVQKFEGKITNFRAWSIKLTRNLCIDIIRERSRGATGVESIELVGETDEMGIASSVESPESCLEREEKSIEIRRAIADLSETLRETFILHFYEELSHIEIAERQGISYNNVSRRIYVAKKKLKEKLSNYFLGTGKKVSVTAGVGRKLSTQRKYGEKQQRIESEERKGLEIGTKQLQGDCPTFDGHSIYPSPHHPITPSPTSSHHPITPSPTSPHHPITPSPTSPHHPITPSPTSPHHPITHITPSPEEVVEAEKDGRVQSLVVSKDNRDIQKINNFIQPFYRTVSKGDQKSFFLHHPRSEKIASLLSVACCLSTVNKSHQKKYFPCCLSRKRSRWLKPYVMWQSLTGDNTKYWLSSRLMGEMKLFLNVRSSLKDIQIWHRSLTDTGGL
ncbi:sigma-70 family RNA polymerase sigma factor [Okeania sp. KiyG1]|uniref:sigma-70 family RNA polymerase sigma factor n=1 Tax=Okeania sp. KiyG1 TaxID=2720165 RepID=UPI00192316EF|nr:sigma-70 family RNA polymerase sigma factor [Okeania sp. KiyG1]